MASLAKYAFPLVSSVVSKDTKKKLTSQVAPPKPAYAMPDVEEIRRLRRKTEASRVGSGRASTVLSQGTNYGTLGPA